tara:strand:- start:89 stop:601 length:513 start_codon:yes stop_codon:yes gene_type:complete
MIIVMNRTILIPILLSTFLLVGCETELDRCIEANESVLDMDSLKNRTVQLARSDSKITIKSILYRNTAPEVDQIKVAKTIKEFNDSLTPIEHLFLTCLKDDRMFVKAFKYKYEEFVETADGKNHTREQFDEEMENHLQQLVIDSSHCNPETLVEPEKERATKVCHAQGIY